MEQRSGGPVAAAVDVLGDRWTLLILSDVIFGDRRYFRGLLTGASDGIASNILADRLVKLVEAGILARGIAMRGQRARYSLTEAGIQTLPIICALGNWGLEWRPATGRYAGAQQLIRDGGPELLAELMDDLRLRHLGSEAVPSNGPGALERLDANSAKPDNALHQ